MGHKLLLIGGTGLLGSEVFFCAKDKFDVILASETKDSNYLTEEITSKNWRYCDITKPDTIEKMLDEEDFDYIVLLAAKIATLSGSVVDSNSELFRVNFKGNMDALRLISRKPGQKFIFISSMTVYSPVNSIPAAEDSLLSPVHPYGLYKKWMEEAISYYATRKNLKTIVLRFPGLFGEKRRNGYMYNVTKKLTAGEEAVLDPGDMAYWEALYVKDAARAVNKVLEEYDWERPYEVFNAGYGVEVDFTETAYKIKELLGSASEITLKNSSYSRFFMSNEKFKRTFGDALGSFQDSLAKYVKEIQ